ncbi:hypothetical protein [Sedimentitalea todarodis]|uniref:PAS domain-containing protein n=1 Tax=Sedimentitalea todarodis TaxID=1631240 RepID=A0ABU3VL73_9RHOB|nr:hypothetical protein [Sedimentitalea todarodis]MDU9006920.1 hypothetical protein [Sedimentitalea todarodis]
MTDLVKCAAHLQLVCRGREGMLRKQHGQTSMAAKSRVLIVEADRSERVVWISPFCARLNGWSGENRCAAEIPVLRGRANAA